LRTYYKSALRALEDLLLCFIFFEAAKLLVNSKNYEAFTYKLDRDPDLVTAPRTIWISLKRKI
jgi:hypothetical protein